MRSLPPEKASSLLIEKLREGDENAFRMIYDRFYQKIYHFTWSFLKDTVHTEEVVQETFLTLWTHRAQLDEHKPLDPWLFTIVRRQIVDVFRKMSSSRRLQQELWERVTALHNETEEKVLAVDLAHFMEEAIASLPRQQQLVFHLSRVEHLSYDEIADQLQISRYTVRNHLVAALKTLKAQFVKHGLYLYFVFIFAQAY